MHGLAVTPVCSTVPLLKPSIPTQNDAKAFLVLQETVGIVKDPLTSVTAPTVVVLTAYPAQLELPTVVIEPRLGRWRIFWMGELERWDDVAARTGTAPTESTRKTPMRQAVINVATLIFMIADWRETGS